MFVGQCAIILSHKTWLIAISCICETLCLLAYAWYDVHHCLQLLTAERERIAALLDQLTRSSEQVRPENERWHQGALSRRMDEGGRRTQDL